MFFGPFNLGQAKGLAKCCFPPDTFLEGHLFIEQLRVSTNVLAIMKVTWLSKVLTSSHSSVLKRWTHAWETSVKQS